MYLSFNEIFGTSPINIFVRAFAFAPLYAVASALRVQALMLRSIAGLTAFLPLTCANCKCRVQPWWVYLFRFLPLVGSGGGQKERSVVTKLIATN